MQIVGSLAAQAGRHGGVVMKIFSYTNKLVLIVAFFCSLITYGYRVYQDNGVSIEFPNVVITDFYNREKQAIEQIPVLKYCDSELFVLRKDYAYDPFAYGVSCYRSLGMTMLFSIIWFVVPFLFIAIFGSAIVWATRTRKTN